MDFLPSNNHTLHAAKNIGLEIECPFNFYYPDIYQKYLAGRGYDKLSRKEKKAFSDEISMQEPQLLAKLETISKELGLMRGVDRYREFVYPATTQLHTHIEKTQRLISENLLPYQKPLSTHITIGNISKEHAYAILTLLEQQFLTPRRLAEAIATIRELKGGRGKGKGGVVYKTGKQLTYGDTSACELRTLKIPMYQLQDCMKLCKTLLDTDTNILIERAKQLVTSMGLPWRPRHRDHIRHYNTIISKQHTTSSAS